MYLTVSLASPAVSCSGLLCLTVSFTCWTLLLVCGTLSSTWRGRPWRAESLSPHSQSPSQSRWQEHKHDVLSWAVENPERAEGWHEVRRSGPPTADRSITIPPPPTPVAVIKCQTRNDLKMEQFILAHSLQGYIIPWCRRPGNRNRKWLATLNLQKEAERELNPAWFLTLSLLFNSMGP